MTDQQNVNEQWIILTTRMGEDIANPSPEAVAEALKELYQDCSSRKDALDYEEHPNVYLRYSLGDSLMYVLDFYRSGLVLLSEYADLDFNNLVRERRMEPVSYERALLLSMCLLEGNIHGLSLE